MGVYMFLTRPEDSEWVPPFEGLEDALGWGAVELSAALPWFCVEFQVLGPRGTVQGHRTFLLASTRALADALESAASGSERPRPSRITGHFPPKWSSARETWHELKISEVWQAEALHQGTSHLIWLFKSTAGDIATELPGLEGTPHLRRCIYSDDNGARAASS